MIKLSEDTDNDFGQNWMKQHMIGINTPAVDQFCAAISHVLKTDTLKGWSLLDIGCGVGMKSLAAIQLGADRVVSFDLDPNCVAAARRVREYSGNTGNWEILQGSVLDKDFMSKLASFDAVCAWNVLDHTGDLWLAVRNSGIPLRSDGSLYVSLNSIDLITDKPSDYWVDIKKRYYNAGLFGRKSLELWYSFNFDILPALKSWNLSELGFLKKSTSSSLYWSEVRKNLEGWPIEFSSIFETIDFCKTELGLDLCNLITKDAETEFVFSRTDQDSHWGRIMRNRQLVTLNPPFRHRSDKCYYIELLELGDCGDTGQNIQASELMLYEDRRALGKAHSIHDDISTKGGGRFCHWINTLYFSSSDGTDPNTNGRTYAYCAKY